MCNTDLTNACRSFQNLDRCLLLPPPANHHYKPEEDIKFECNNLGCDLNKEIFAKFTGNKSEISLNDMNDI